MFFIDSKKSVSAVVASLLLLVVAIISIVSLQTWYDNYQEATLVQVEEKSGINDIITIEGIFGGELYVKGDLEQKSISKIEIKDNSGSKCVYQDFLNNSNIEGNLILHMPFDRILNNGTHNISEDISGNNLNGIILDPINISSGKIGNSYNFYNSSILINYDPIINFTDNFSIVLWTKVGNNYNANPRLLSRGWAESYEVCLDNPNDELYMALTNSSGNIYGKTNTNDEDGQWHHFIFSYTGSRINVFRDGVSVTNYSFNNLKTSNSDLVVGAINIYHSDNYVGHIDELKIYNQAINSTQARFIYAGTNFNNIGNINSFNVESCNLVKGKEYEIVFVTNDKVIEKKIIKR